jgi:hypothetical protein
VEKWKDAAIKSIVESAPQMLGGSIHYSNSNYSISNPSGYKTFAHSNFGV